MTDKYLKITNKTDSVSRVSLEKLGLSTKRNDPGTIGQFGSGIKFAPIAALRNGLEWWFTGSDANGSYKMKYDIQVEDGVDCIVYNYGDYIKSSSFTVDAGCLSWVDYFQIYREAVSNAIDESKSNDDWSISVVDREEIAPVNGEFSVFITASPEIMDIHNNFHKYFCVNRVGKYTVENIGGYDRVQMIPKIDNNFRVYSHGVLVYENSEYNSFYDYNIDNLTLNEERRLSSPWDLEWIISLLFAKLSDLAIIDKILNLAMSSSNYFEFEKMSSSTIQYADVSEKWSQIFYANHGDNSVIYEQSSEVYNLSTSIKLKGYNPVSVNGMNLFKFLTASGVRSYTDILDEDFDIKTDFDIEKYPNVDKALNIAMSYIPNLLEIVESQRFGVYESDLKNNLGITLNIKADISERKIYIHKSHAVNDSVENILATIVHEYDHLSTGISDSDYLEFRDIADKRIASLMVNNYRSDFIVLKNGAIELPIKKLGSSINNLEFSISRVKGLDGLLVCLGGYLFKINIDSLFNDLEINGNVSGLLSPSGLGDSLTIQGLTNVTNITHVN
jgi:hypothetical protein